MKICRQCQRNFEVTDQDRTFYDKVSIPEPTLCPPCREQRRLAWKNERNLYRRTCDLCKGTTISIYSKDKPYQVYCQKCWWSDQWDPMQYGIDYDFNKPFFDQFNALIEKVPKQALHHNQNENCDYTTSTSFNRNCYLISSSGYNEDCYYGIFLKGNRSCIDNTHIIKSELCYECIDSKGGYNLKYCQNTYDCSDSAFLFDCRNCHHCFLSCGLRNKQYVFRNQPLSKEQYEQKMPEINLTSYNQVETLKNEYMRMVQNYPHLYYDGQNNENVSFSNNIFNSKNCSFCFDAYDLEDCKFCSWYNESKDCYDIYAFGYGSELCYESLEIGQAYRVLLSMHCWNSVSDLLYCLACQNSQHLCGCAGIKHREYCILNKQYTKAEYESLVPKIIKHMGNEWGEFLPPSFSHFGYNETMAQDFYPMSEEQVRQRGWKWHTQKDEIPQVEKMLSSDQLPDKTKDIPDDIVKLAIRCKKSNRPFRILKQELQFYRRQNVPFPRLHPDERHKQRMNLRNQRQFFTRPCFLCGTEIQTSYATENPIKVYCEKCYLQEIY